METKSEEMMILESLSRVRICRKCGREFFRERYALKQTLCQSCIPDVRRTRNDRPIKGSQIIATTSLEVIASELGVTKERVRQIETKALRKFKIRLKIMYPELYKEFIGGIYIESRSTHSASI